MFQKLNRLKGFSKNPLNGLNLKPLKRKKPLNIQRFFVPRTGFEPAHLAAPPPEDGASTNFATWAFKGDANVG